MLGLSLVPRKNPHLDSKEKFLLHIIQDQKCKVYPQNQDNSPPRELNHCYNFQNIIISSIKKASKLKSWQKDDVGVKLTSILTSHLRKDRSQLNDFTWKIYETFHNLKLSRWDLNLKSYDRNLLKKDEAAILPLKSEKRNLIGNAPHRHR